MKLDISSTGEAVRQVQKILKLKEDGYYGPITKNAVMQWQREHGLVADGIVGSQTWAAMLIPIDDPIVYVAPDTDISIPYLSKLTGIIPSKYLDELPVVLHTFKVTPSPLLIAHFLSQCAAESRNFTVFEENLNYSAERLCVVFDKHFTNKDMSIAYAHRPAEIANYVYANKNGNGGVASGDGFLYRGRGAIQLTGKANYARFDTYVRDDIINNPNLVAGKYALLSAAYFFNVNKLWLLCRMGSSSSDVLALTKRVNGGINGLAERTKYFNTLYSLITA